MQLCRVDKWKVLPLVGFDQHVQNYYVCDLIRTLSSYSMHCRIVRDIYIIGIVYTTGGLASLTNKLIGE